MSDSAAKHRAKQTVRNLILSLLVSLGLMVALVLGVPRDDSNRIQAVDYQQIAVEVSESLGADVSVPELPEGWWSNAARLESRLDVSSWYAGFVTPDNQFIGLTQTFEGNPSWLALTLQGNWLEDEVTIEGKKWEIWPTLKPSTPPGTKEYAMVYQSGSTMVVIYGTASKADFETFAASLSKTLN